MSTTIRKAQARNNTGVCGITEQVLAKTGRRTHRYFIVTPQRRRFNIDTLGRPEAFRRALQLRAGHEIAVMRAARPVTSHQSPVTAKEAPRG
jgi:hypothetical protein